METKVKLDRQQAIQIHDCIRMMVGSPSYQILRQSVISKIEKAWPEILVGDNATEPDTVREIEIDGREQRAVAEGFIVLFNRKDQAGEYALNNAAFTVLQKACKICKVWNWVKSKIVTGEVEEFNERLDDEPPLSDEEAVEAK